jgi:hypothetical protein
MYIAAIKRNQQREEKSNRVGERQKALCDANSLEQINRARESNRGERRDTVFV